MIDTKIKTLITLVNIGSYTRAAEALHLTQPAVSHHIRLLEKEFGIKIFQPDKKELKPTPEGAVLIKYAHRVMAIYNKARVAIDDSRKEAKHLFIGLTQTAGENFMPQVIATYCNEHPHTIINICTDTIKNLYERLQLYELDMAVVGGTLPGSDFNSVLLDTDSLCLIVSPQHPFAKRRSISLHELKTEKLILRTATAGTRILFDNYLAGLSESVKNFNLMMELDNIAMTKELVSMNLGVSIIAKSACLDEVRHKKLVIVPIENVRMTREINIIYQKDFSHPEILEELRQIYERLLIKMQ